ncbi:2-nitropropane dioxygenase, partial [Streptomyces sp. NPDC005568]
MPDRTVFSAHTERLRSYYYDLGAAASDYEAVEALPGFDDQIDALLAAAPPVISFVMGIPPHRVAGEA